MCQNFRSKQNSEILSFSQPRGPPEKVGGQLNILPFIEGEGEGIGEGEGKGFNFNLAESTMQLLLG